MLLREDAEVEAMESESEGERLTKRHRLLLYLWKLMCRLRLVFLPNLSLLQQTLREEDAEVEAMESESEGGRLTMCNRLLLLYIWKLMCHLHLLYLPNLLLV